MSEGLIAERSNEPAESSDVLVARPAVLRRDGVGETTLRDAHDGDSDAVIALIREVWSEYPGKNLDVRRDMPELLAVASTYRSYGGRFWVLQRQGELIATVAVKPSADPGTVELQKLYVARGERRHGFGERLCALVEDEGRRRDCRTVELWSDVKLLDAHRLYERLGYLRGSGTRLYDDSSGTVRFYYRKALSRRQIGAAFEHPAAAAERAWTVAKGTPAPSGG